MAGVALAGPRPSLMRDVPVALYAVGRRWRRPLLARGRCAGAAGWRRSAAVVVLLGLPAGGLAEFVTKGYIRVGTTLGVFAALIALDAPAGRRVGPAASRSSPRCWRLTILADTYALVIGAVAVLAVCLWGLIRRGRIMRTSGSAAWPLAVVGVGGGGAGGPLVADPARSAGTGVTPLPLRDYCRIPTRSASSSANVRALATYLPSLYRCDERGAPAVRRLWLACLIGPGAGRLVRDSPLRRRPRPADFVGDVLAGLDAPRACSAYLASGIAEGPGDDPVYDPVRALGGRARPAGCSRAGSRPRGRWPSALGLLGLAYAVTVADDLRKPPADDPAVALAAWLDAHGLRHGYGPYWDASIVTVSSGGRVAVRPSGAGRSRRSSS